MSHLKVPFIVYFGLVVWSVGSVISWPFNHLTPNDHYMGLTAQLTSRCCILYSYSTNMRTDYFKYAAQSPFFSLFKMPFISFIGSCIIHILNTECANI